MEMTGEVMDREILVLRGDLETVKAAEKYMFEALDKKIDEWGKKDKEEKYKKFYEEQASLRMKELKENPESACNWDLTLRVINHQSIITHLFFPSQSFKENSLTDVVSISFFSRSEIHWAIVSAVGLGRISFKQL